MKSSSLTAGKRISTGLLYRSYRSSSTKIAFVHQSKTNIFYKRTQISTMSSIVDSVKVLSHIAYLVPVTNFSEHHRRELWWSSRKARNPPILALRNPRPHQQSRRRNRRQRRYRLRRNTHSPLPQHQQALHPLRLRRSRQRRQKVRC